LKEVHGSFLLMRAECSRLMLAAARLPARMLPANNQFPIPFSQPAFGFRIQLDKVS